MSEPIPQIGDRVSIIGPMDDKHRGFCWWYVGDVRFISRTDCVIMSSGQYTHYVQLNEMYVTLSEDYERAAELRQRYLREGKYILTKLQLLTP